MIKTKDLVPSIYYNKSRDFQAIGRTFEVIYNYLKTNTDLVLNSYEDIKMLDLLAKTVGFNSKHTYNTDDLYALCNSFVTILKNKGSIKSIELAVILLLNAQHIESKFYVDDVTDASNKKQHSLDIYIPKELSDTILLDDLFDYILPAGYTYRFIKSTFISEPRNTYAYVQSTGNAQKYEMNDTAFVAIVTGSGLNIIRPSINTEAEPLGISYASVVFLPESR